jgi:hypothetical protein
MKQLRRLGVSMAMTGLLTAGALAAGTAVAGAATRIGSCTAQGDFATCVASGTADGPATLTVTVTSSPDQQVYVAWSDVCAEGTGAGSSSGSFTAQTPVSRNISHPYSRPDSCTVSADAQLQAGGNTITVSLSYSKTAATAPASHEIRGYAGKCIDDNGDSSAPRAKVQIWDCANNAAQRWSLSNGELKHGSMCMDDKATAGSGSPVILWSCNGSSGETWTHNSHGEYVLKAHGGTLCLDDPGYSTRNGTQLIVYTCKGAANQRWSLP